MNVRRVLMVSVVIIVAAVIFFVAQEENDPLAQVETGEWQLVYEEGCRLQEPKLVLLQEITPAMLRFDDITLTVNDDGIYEGETTTTASMPEDGREIPVFIEYTLAFETPQRFAGEETITESGFDISCPIALVPLNVE